MDSLPRIGFHSKDATGSHRTHELPLDRADQSGHRLASLRLGEHGQRDFPDPEPEDHPDDRFRPGSGDHRDQCGRRRLRVDPGEGGDRRVRPQSDRSRRQRHPDQFQRQGGKGADQSWRRRLQEPQGVRSLGPAGGSPRARRSRRPRSGAQGPAQGTGGARAQARRGDRSAEDRRHRFARRDRSGEFQVSARRGQCRAAERDQPQRFSRRIEPAGRPPPAQCRRVDAVKDRHRGDAQGHRHRGGGQRVDLRPQPAGRRTACSPTTTRRRSRPLS